MSPTFVTDEFSAIRARDALADGRPTTISSNAHDAVSGSTREGFRVYWMKAPTPRATEVVAVEASSKGAEYFGWGPG
jgi:hypothetical protein